MKSVLIYLKPTCPYCQSALQLLAQKGSQPEIVDILRFPERRAEMIEKSAGRTTVPQIFIDNVHIGGCDDLYALEEAKTLDSLLGIA